MLLHRQLDPVVKEMTRKRSLRLLSPAYYLRHGLSKAALKFFLSFDEHCFWKKNETFQKMKSPFTLLNSYKHLKSDIRKIYVCRKCKNILHYLQFRWPNWPEPSLSAYVTTDIKQIKKCYRYDNWFEWFSYCSYFS